MGGPLIPRQFDTHGAEVVPDPLRGLAKYHARGYSLGPIIGFYWKNYRTPVALAPKQYRPPAPIPCP